MTIYEQRAAILTKLDESERPAKILEFERTDAEVAKMRTRLKVYFRCTNLRQSLDALYYVFEKHENQIRKSGARYIIHPLSMACHFMGYAVPDDNLFATILYHDVIEESAPDGQIWLTSEVTRLVEELPAGEVVRSAVRLMTISKAYPEEPKSAMKWRYFAQFMNEDKLENRVALKCKAFDRYDNSRTMTQLSKRAIRKNVLETAILLLPNLKAAGNKWSEESDKPDVWYLLRSGIKDLNDTLAQYNGIFDKHDEAELKRLLDDPEYLKDE